MQVKFTYSPWRNQPIFNFLAKPLAASTDVRCQTSKTLTLLFTVFIKILVLKIISNDYYESLL